ncbi:MAG: B12-binding domain-containing radical SAM protein [Acidobacteria bacterium]|nr:B12-binding domain-containing radical SAM protein [Acidobacteriota bacterium]
MNILLLSMPDSFEHTPTLTIRMPNGALASLAGSVDPHHQVAIADLVLVQRRVRDTIERLVHDLRPDVVGLSIMTFQRHTAKKIIRLLRWLRPALRVVVGGYDPSLDPGPYEDPSFSVDVVVRGEGDVTFRELVRALEAGGSLDTVAGLSYRTGDRFVHNPDRAVARLEVERLPLPNRAARVIPGYTCLGRPIDVVETSRGCTYDCSFCSIIEMRGRNFHPFPIDRVLADIADARARGARTIFLVDDNITLDVHRFEDLCRAIVRAGFADVDYIVQAMTSSIANHGETLAPLMKQAGFRYVFLGIENILDEDLGFLRAQAKNARREGGRKTGNATIQAVDTLHRHGMFVVGGLIVGNPDDTRESIEANLAFARQYVDWPYIQHPTPYPRTPMTRDFREQDLIVNENYAEYDGTTAVVRSKHLSAEEIEFMRWRAERWMKVRHLPSVLAHHPAFVLRHGIRMLAHTFRGSTWKSMLGLESERAVFRRYKAIRKTEREYLPSDDLEAGPGYRVRDAGYAAPSTAD